MEWLPDGEKISKIIMFIRFHMIHERDRRTDGQTDRQTHTQTPQQKPGLQELSYRKQIARQLRTQFVEGISVTLKSTLRVTQGHWKRNHWTDHTRLTIRRVIGR